MSYGTYRSFEEERQKRIESYNERYKAYKKEKTKEEEKRKEKIAAYDKRYKEYAIQRYKQEIYDRTSQLIKQSNSLVTDHNARYEGGNDKWRGDASDYFFSVSDKTTANGMGVQIVLDLLDRYGNNYDEEFNSSIRSAIQDSMTIHSQIYSEADSDRAYWGQWKDETEYEYAKYATRLNELDSKVKSIIENNPKGVDRIRQAEIDELVKEMASISDIMKGDKYTKYNASYRYAENEKKIAGLKARIEEEYGPTTILSLRRNANVAAEKIATTLENPGTETRYVKLNRELEALMAENDRLLEYADPKRYEEYQNLNWAAKTLNTALSAVQNLHYGAKKGVEDVVDFINTAGTAGAKALSNIGIELGTRSGLMSEGMAKAHRARANEKEAERIEKIQYNWSADNLLLGGKKHDYYFDKNLLSGNTVANEMLTETTQGVGRLLPNVALTYATGGLSSSLASAGYANAAANLTKSIPTLSKAVFALSAAGSGANEAFEQGASSIQAAGYGASVGALETATEALGGTVFGEAVDLGSTAVGRFLQKNGLDKYVSQGVGKYAYTFISEGAEEVLSDGAAPILKAAFDIGDAREKYSPNKMVNKYLGSNGLSEWLDLLGSAGKTFTVGGLVGVTMQGLQSGASALINSDKGGFKYNAISGQMSIIENAMKANQMVQASDKMSEKQKKAASEQLDKTFKESIGRISELMKALTAEQRNTVFEEAPILAAFLDESGNVVVESAVAAQQKIASSNIEYINVDYDDIETKNKITKAVHDEMIANGDIVNVSNDITAEVSKSFPDLHNLKKKDRLPILKRSMLQLKQNIRQFLNSLREQSFEFDINGHILEARLYNPGIKEVLEKITQEKANMLYSTESIFGNARYLYSTPDYSGDPNVYRWNYFYTPVQIENQDYIGVRIAIRDVINPNESQIYNWGIKKDTLLDGVGRGTNNRISHDVSSSVSNNNISQPEGIVNRENLSSAGGQVAEYARILKIGEQGVQDLNNVISSMGEGIDVANVVQAYNAVYQVGKQGKDISEARNPHLNMLSAEQKEIAYNAGFMDSVIEKKTSGKVLQKDGESGKIDSTSENPNKVEDSAIWHYKSSESYKINEAIRSGRELTAEEVAFIEDLDSELEKTPKYSGVTYRNISFDMEGQEAFEAFVAEHIEGEDIMYPAYTSTSKSKTGYVVDGELLVHIEIYGENGHDISRIGNEEEQEVLFDRKTEFEIKSIDNDGKTVNIVLEEIGYGEKEVRGSNKWDTARKSRPSDSEGRTSSMQQMQTVVSPRTNEKLPYLSRRDTQRDTSKRNDLQGLSSEIEEINHGVQEIQGEGSVYSDNGVPPRGKRGITEGRTVQGGVSKAHERGVSAREDGGDYQGQKGNEQGAVRGSDTGNKSTQQGYDSEGRTSQMQQMQASGYMELQVDRARNSRRNIGQRDSLQGVRAEVNESDSNAQQSKENAIEPERVVYSSKKAMAYDAVAEDNLDGAHKKAVSIGKDIGRKVVVADTRTADGVRVDGFLGEDGVIYISKYNKSPVAFVFKHELAHFCERAGQKYRDFVKAVRFSATFKNWLKKKGYSSMMEYNSQIRKERAEVGMDPGEDGANNEIIANFVAEMMFGDDKSIADRLIGELKPKERRSVRQFLRDFFDWIKSRFTGKGNTARSEILKLEKMFGQAFRTAVNVEQSADIDVQFSIQEIVGDSGTSYGIGVYLDSTLLTNLTGDERIEMVKEYIKELGGKSFTAYDSNGNEVEVHIAETSQKFKNKSGKKVPVNKDLSNKNIKFKTKQESIALINELVRAAEYDAKKSPQYSHDWLDNYGKNDWEYWTVYVQDKENTVWEATLNVATSANGEKILYDINPIRMVEGAAKDSTSSTDAVEQSISLDTSTTDISISDSDEKNNSQNAQNFYDGTEQFSYNPQNDKVEDVFGRLRNGEISLNDAEKLLKKPEKDNPVNIANTKKEDMSTTPKLNKKTTGKVGDGDSKFAASLQRSKIFNEDFKAEVKDDNFVKHYAAVTNKETLAEAAKRLDEGGEAYVREWFSKKAEHMDTVDTMAGFILLKRFQDAGDYSSAVAVAQKVRAVGTLSGQRVQTFSIIGRFDADMMQAFAQKELDDALAEMIKDKGEAWGKKNKERFKLTDEEIAFIRDNILYAAEMPENSRARAIALAQITTLIQNKIPPVKCQGYKAWQRVSMLLNPKTQLRNVVGNLLAAPVFVASDWFSTPVDFVVSKFTGVRTTGLTGVRGIGTNLKAAGKGLYESIDDFRRHINTKKVSGNRFEIGKGKSFDEARRGRIAKIMNSFDEFTSFLLDAGDRPFYEMWFTNSLNEQMRLNKVSEPTEEMVQIAVDEALARTWQDDNLVTNMVSGIKRAANHLKIGRYGVGDVIVKFTKTPANLTKAIYDFSPAAIATLAPQAIRLTKAIKNGTVTPAMQKKFVSNFGKMAAGTMLYVVFAALYAAGHISGSSDEDKDVAAFEKYIQGMPAYSIKIGDKWFSYDWAQPIGAVPAIIADYMESREEGSDAITSVWEAFKAGGDVLYNQSFMSSFQTLFTADDPLSGVLDLVLGEITVPIPTVFSQLANVLDDKRRVTYDSTSELKSALNRAMLKIPGLRNTLEAEVDVLGREVKNTSGNKLKDFLNAFFNPANTYTDTSTKITDHAYEIYQSTGDVGAIPPKAPYSVILQGKSVKLDISERAIYQKTMGEVSSDLIKLLLENDVYNAMNDEEKLAILKQIYSYSATVAKSQLDWANDYEVINGIAPYITEKDFGAMDYEERYKIVDDYLFSGYDGLQNVVGEEGQANFLINKKTASMVLDATVAGNIDEAVKLIDGIENRVKSYGWDEEDTDAEIEKWRAEAKKAITKYWKQFYLYAYNKGNIDEQERIIDMLVSLDNLYGNRIEVKKTVKDWIKTYEESN